MDAIQISRTGLDVEWQRLQVIAQNFANANSSRTAGGELYRPLRLLSGPKIGFGALLGGAVPAAGGVEVKGIAPMAGGVRRVHEPGHPGADSEGYVTYPEIDQAEQMTLLIKTSRAYEANLTAMGIAQQMYTRAAELGRQS